MVHGMCRKNVSLRGNPSPEQTLAQGNACGKSGTAYVWGHRISAPVRNSYSGVCCTATQEQQLALEAETQPYHWYAHAHAGVQMHVHMRKRARVNICADTGTRTHACNISPVQTTPYLHRGASSGRQMPLDHEARPRSCSMGLRDLRSPYQGCAPSLHR